MKSARTLFATAVLSLSLAALSACKASNEENAYLKQPAVGDLYAVELSHFSGGSFSGSSQGEAVYGLMKIVEVTPDKVVFVTENGGWPNAQGARNDLNGDLADVTWDTSEKIPVKRADLAGYFGDEIIEIRRPGDASNPAKGGS